MTDSHKKFFFDIKDLEPFRDEKPTKIGEEIRRVALENDALEQDILLKRNTLKTLIRFLGAETVVIFIFAFLQATKLCDFALEEWSFKLLVTATLLQITYMLQVAVKHLFPNK